jgi:hypothetical protein
VIAGSYVGFAWNSPEGDCGYAGIELADARTGRDNLIDVEKCASAKPIQRVVVKAPGRIAWTEHHEVLACLTGCFATRLGLPKMPVLGKVTMSEERTLRATPRGIEWRHNGRWVHARL